MRTQLLVEEGDITQLKVDVVVNAANQSLAGGGGVDGAIHRAAGKERLQAACQELGSCATGDVKATAAFDLPAKAIFHAVGPRYKDGQQGESALLARCYQRSMAMAEQAGYQSIAFPAISCGIYGYPLDEAVEIAISSVRESLSDNSSLQRVIFCCFDSDMADRYRQVLNAE